MGHAPHVPGSDGGERAAGVGRVVAEPAHGCEGRGRRVHRRARDGGGRRARVTHLVRARVRVRVHRPRDRDPGHPSLQPGAAQLDVHLRHRARRRHRGTGGKCVRGTARACERGRHRAAHRDRAAPRSGRRWDPVRR